MERLTSRGSNRRAKVPVASPWAAKTGIRRRAGWPTVAACAVLAAAAVPSAARAVGDGSDQTTIPWLRRRQRRGGERRDGERFEQRPVTSAVTAAAALAASDFGIGDRLEACISAAMVKPYECGVDPANRAALAAQSRQLMMKLNRVWAWASRTTAQSKAMGYGPSETADPVATSTTRSSKNA